MRILGKPKNYWGWLRVVSLAILAGVLIWSMITAVLRLMGDVPWMNWSAYQSFGGQEILEFSIIPILLIVFAGVFEERDHQYSSSLAEQEKLIQEMASKRKEILTRFEEALESAIVEAENTEGQLSAKSIEVINAHLLEFDEIGKGEMLQLLNQKDLLNHEILTVLQSADLRETVLENVQLPGVSLDHLNLYHAQMSGANLQRSSFIGANLRRALLRFTDLSGANLNGCNLHVANLDEANLQSADLTGADLSGAFLRKTNLKGCVVDPAALEEAVLIEAILPDGRKTTNPKGVAFLHKKDLEAAINGL